MLTEKTDRVWFSCLLRHPARKRSRSILTTWEPARVSNRSDIRVFQTWLKWYSAACKSFWITSTLAWSQFTGHKQSHSTSNCSPSPLYRIRVVMYTHDVHFSTLQLLSVSILVNLGFQRSLWLSHVLHKPSKEKLLGSAGVSFFLQTSCPSCHSSNSVKNWRNTYISQSMKWTEIVSPLSSNNCGQVVYIYVFLSWSSIICYWPKDSYTLQLPAWMDLAVLSGQFSPQVISVTHRQNCHI